MCQVILGGVTIFRIQMAFYNTHPACLNNVDCFWDIVVDLFFIAVIFFEIGAVFFE